MGCQRCSPRLSRDPPDPSGQNARNHSPRRPRRPHSRNGRLSPNHARAAHQARLWRGARLLLWPHGTHRPSRRHLRGRRDFLVRHRSLRRRERSVSLSRRALLHGALLRIDRAPLRRPHAPDARGQPHPEARRPPGAHHPQRRRAARHLGHSAGLPSRLSSMPTSSRRNRAKWTRATTANTRRAKSRSCSRIPVSQWRAWKPANSATCRIPNTAG